MTMKKSFSQSILSAGKNQAFDTNWKFQKFRPDVGEVQNLADIWSNDANLARGTRGHGFTDYGRDIKPFIWKHKRPQI